VIVLKAQDLKQKTSAIPVLAGLEIDLIEPPELSAVSAMLEGEKETRRARPAPGRAPEFVSATRSATRKTQTHR
jgi:hypothetical protein